MWAFLAVLPLGNALFFGGGSSCGCSAPPACPPPPPPPVCAPALPAPCPAQPSCGGGYSSSYSAPVSYPAPASFPAPVLPSIQPLPSYAQAPVAPVYNPAPVAPAYNSAPVAPVYNPAPVAPAYNSAPVAPIYNPAPAPVAPVAPTYNTAPAPTYAEPARVYPVPAPAPAPAQGYQQTPAYVAQEAVAAASEAQEQSVVQPAVVTQEYQAGAAVETNAAQEVSAADPAHRDEGGAAVAASKNAEVIEEENPKMKSEGRTEKAGEEKGEERVVDIATLKLTDDPLCNSDDLRNLMLENMDENLNNSKRLIQLAAEAQFGGRFDVICANGDFSYVTNTELYCQESKGDVSCYTYRQL